MNINIKKLKESLSLDNYETIIESLDIPIVYRNNTMWSLKSGCHSLNCNDCDDNLKFYIETKTFTCFSHNCIIGGDIIELVKIRHQLVNQDFTFIDSINYIIDVLNIDIKKLQSKNVNNLNWKNILNKYIKDEDVDIDINIYDEYILKYFPKIYHEDWLDYGISIKTMDKFELGYYSFKNTITIPCRDYMGNLIGIRGRYFKPEDIELGKYRPITLYNGESYNFPTSSYFYGEYQNFKNIKEKRIAILVESEKATLISDDWFDKSCTLGLYGNKLSKYKRNKLLELGVEEVVIGIDFDYDDLDSEEFIKYQENIYNIAKQFYGFCKISVLISYENHNKKDNPMDNGKEFYMNLWNKREIIG